MHKELEALIRAYDAAREGRGSEAARLREVFESQVEEALARRPELNRETLLSLIRLQHRRWLCAQETPPTLPPAA